MLWPDTFNNYFHTDVGVACVEAIEAAGWQVVMPQGHVCCGRPLYDYGFLDLAERYLRRTLGVLLGEIRAGTPVVGMEPSCLAVFKDELGKMLPHDDDARRLAEGAYHFGEFFQAFGIEPPRLERSALLWGHCHHKATGGVGSDKDLLRQHGGRRARGDRRLLRPGRLVGLRGRPPRALDGDRRARAAPGRARAPAEDR